ncbi:LysR substrate-binding domain-containing protein [Marinomonas fungiae]|uniref:DNA-binding transcriptional regulator, LysR family n=1 Tax=Marinomonas fungiae TaxID=1137284 RepID=A0A0K6IPW4_9GAMM|nr:LysR substrate-binding domain-containing protein [Marinomonas fungiae]CUB05160.1 DNA-binding transcriptional regulator, LysR family [Marinomonas fungiae]
MLKLPNLNCLVTFINAAQTCNFAKTAKILCITPAAVSQQIKQLESVLNTSLFERSKQGVELTQAGKQYLYFANQALESLQRGQACIDQLKQQAIFTLHTLPSVASLWLMPKVLQIMEQHSDLEIRVEASHAIVNFNLSQCDASISFGKQDALLQHDFLFQDHVQLVASPKLMNGIEPSDINSLLEKPMIHIDWGDENPYLPNWQDWLNAAGQSHRKPNKGPQFNLSSMAIDAAVQGKGLLLGQGLFIQHLLESGQLVTLSPLTLPLGKAYYLVYPNRTLYKPGALALIEQLKNLVP